MRVGLHIRSPLTAMQLRIELLRDVHGRSTAETNCGALFKVSEQPDRTGSPRRQVEDPTYAWLQELQICRDHNRWHRTAPPYPQRSIRLESTADQRASCARDLEGRASRVKARSPLPSHHLAHSGYLHHSQLEFMRDRRQSRFHLPVSTPSLARDRRVGSGAETLRQFMRRVPASVFR
jgi:hypothetical protein